MPLAYSWIFNLARMLIVQIDCVIFKPRYPARGRTVKCFKSVSEVIDALGGNNEVAYLTSRSSNAVSNWRTFGKFPTSTFPLIRDALKQIGYSAQESLWAWQEPREERPAAKRKRNVAA
jgi:hypothetical protein